MKVTIQEIIKSDQCTGCGTCANVCPKKCITMIQDNKGFYIPQISVDCIECGKCKGICPMDKKNNFVNIPVKSYAYYNEDSSKKERCSSSGVFGALARIIISKGGVVCGAAFDEQWMVRHIIVDKVEDIYKLCTSKYSQSFIDENLYNQIRKELQKRIVLFSGTPCQVAGVKKMFKEYKNLITVDVVCHGVPSVKVWKLYLESVTNREKILDINFRDKRNKDCYGLKILSSSGEFYESVTENVYMQGYINNLFLRNSCTVCKFKGSGHYSDITLGDLWRADLIDEEFSQKKNISWVIVNSFEGKELLSFVNEQFEIQEIPIKIAKSLNKAYDRSTKHHRNRERFFNDIASGGEICEVISRNNKRHFCEKIRIKIERIVTICNVYLKRR